MTQSPLLLPQTSVRSALHDLNSRTEEKQKNVTLSQMEEAKGSNNQCNTLKNDTSKDETDIIWVEFEKDGELHTTVITDVEEKLKYYYVFTDPLNPFNFSKPYKWSLTILAVLFTFETAATAGSYVSGIPSMERNLNYSNHELSLVGIAVYSLGFSIPPLVLAPFSEVFGRNTLYLVTHFVYTILFIGTGFAQNISTVIVLRFLSGAFGSTGSTMVGGTIADMWTAKERGGPMGVFALSAILGIGFGPFWAGFVEGNTKLQWRWIQYIQAIYTGVIFLLFLTFLRETRGSVLLTRKAARLRRETGCKRYKAKAEEDRASISTLIKISLTRPLYMLFSEPIVTVFSIWFAFAWGFMYMLLESIGLITELHSFGPGQTGLVFLAICVGALIGQLTNPIQDIMYARNVARKGPEARLYSACVAAVAFPIGCFIYGWTAYSHISIAGPIVGIIILMWSVYVIFLAVFNYLADAYFTYASSALAASSFARNMFAFAFPLFTEQMYYKLDYHWASTLAGLLGACLGVVPFILFIWGDTIRSKSKLSSRLQKEQEDLQENE